MAATLPEKATVSAETAAVGTVADTADARISVGLPMGALQTSKC